ncbi:hypothetical protein D3C76_346660 [compost metagenome]
MARRTSVTKIEDKDSRDFGKSFLITEMDAEAAEWWAFRALQGIMGTDAEIDFKAPLSEMARQGLVAMARIPSSQAKPLFDEMMACVRVQLPDGKSSRDILPNDIEEVGTRIDLRAAVFELHTGFSVRGDA